MARRSRTTSSRATSVGKSEEFYPSPFFDIASTYIPKDVKETFEWCLYYTLTNPIISAVISKMASYPITEVLVKDDNEGLVKLVEDILHNQLELRSHLIEFNLDRYTFGSGFTSVEFPIQKQLICPGCKDTKALNNVKYTWKDHGFYFHCEKCNGTVKAKVKDVPIRTFKRIHLIRWNPNDIIIKRIGLGNRKEYSVKIPTLLKNQITLGKPEVVENLPQAFIEAAAKGRTVRIDSDKIFHGRRPSISREGNDSCWGAPLMLPVLKDAFFMQVLKKAQEAVALEYIVPMRILFPNIRAEGDNIYANINLKDWQKEVSGQVEAWKRDVNHMAVMPVPIGYQQVGGQGKSLLLHQEIRIYSEQIIAGMGVSVGFFYGQQSYSGGSVDLRALENEFMSNRLDMLGLVKFILRSVCAFLKIPFPDIDFKPFKMADDLQRSAFDMQLVQQGLISEQSFVESRDFDYAVEQTRRSSEAQLRGRQQIEAAKLQAEAQGNQQLIMGRYQLKAQQEMGQQQPQQPGQEGQPVEGQPQEGQQMEGQPQEGQPVEGQPQQGQEVPPSQQELMNQGGMGNPVSYNPEGNTQYVDMFAQAKGLVAELIEADPVQRHQYLTALRKSNSELYGLVLGGLNRYGNSSNMHMPTSNVGPMPGVAY